MDTIIVRKRTDLRKVKAIGGPTRIALLGASGAGKTTLGVQLSKLLSVDYIELDSLFLKENWRESDKEEFRKKVEEQLKDKTDYIIDGNYRSISDLTWDKCAVLICLDYSKLVIMKRIILRTVRRVLTQEELWNGNRESFKKSFMSKESIILWSWNTYKERKNDYRDLQEKYKYEDKLIIILRNRKAGEWLIEKIEYNKGILAIASTWLSDLPRNQPYD